MSCKKGQGVFLWINILKVLLGVVVTIILLTFVWSFIGPKEKGESSTKKAFEDIVLKLRDVEENRPLTAYGTINKDSMLIAFNSEDRESEGVKRPPKCGALSNSCICACKGFKDGACTKVLECKGFPNSKIKEIKWGNGVFKFVDGAGKPLNGNFKIYAWGGPDYSFTLTMTLSSDNIVSFDGQVIVPELEVLLA